MTEADDDRLSQLLDLWEEAVDRGDEPDPVQLCAGSPELLDEFIRQVAALKAVDARLKLDRETGESGSQQSERTGEEVHTTVCTYRQHQLVARGGLGIVHLARDDTLHRDVVLKFIHRHIAHSEEQQAMFRREAEVTSRLDHPGVVPVYSMGESADGRMFYVMPYIRGTTLDDAIEQLHATDKQATATFDLELRKLLGSFVMVCKAIAYAHNRGIIHRDVKPANVMLGRYGETLVVDWGLATPVGRAERFKQADEKTLRPSGGGTGISDRGVGTPAYMSPEAIQNDGPLAPATDIYSLGATLYKLLTGRTAFEKAELHTWRNSVTRGHFPRPTEIKPGISPALEAICLKAMANEPWQRYATALELAADIENYLADQPVEAYREPVSRRAARWARRHRSLAQGILVAVSAVAVATMLSTAWLGYVAAQERSARLVAQVARQQGLRMSAQFAASTIAQQIDLRWRLLEMAARDAALPALLTAAGTSSDRRQPETDAQRWLAQLAAGWRDGPSIGWDSLFLLDARGIQVARVAARESVAGSLAVRDDFPRRDREGAEREGAESVRHATLSSIYQSSTSGKLKVAFSTPIAVIEQGAEQVLGVLGMSVELEKLGALPTDLQTDQIVVLVDTKTDQLSGKAQRGLILQHPKLGQDTFRPQVARLPLQLLQQIDEVPEGTLLQPYHDPLSDGIWRGICQPVIVTSRPAPACHTGWVVLAQERQDASIR